MPTEPAIQNKVYLLAALIVVAFVGFFFGIRHPSDVTDDESLPIEHKSPINSDELVAAGKAVPARSHAELATSPWRKSQRMWTAPLAQGEPVTPSDRQAHAVAMAARKQRRAFEGAPPTVPHPTPPGATSEQCMVCHEQGTMLGELRAPPMSHPFQSMCTQCHVASNAPAVLRSETLLASARLPTDAPLEEHVRTQPYTPGGPRPLPHTSWMRNNCQACHGVQGAVGLQTSHPERVQCVQCHVPDHRREQVPD